jgi:murein DD-endopeptidase MepM/ murein hydrolase activator NlpD
MHRIRAYLAALLVLVAILGVSSPAYAATRADVAKHRAAAASARAKAAQAAAQAAKLKAETAKLDQRFDSLQSEANALDPKISAADKRTLELRAEVDKLRAKVASKAAEITVTQQTYATEQKLLGERVTASYKRDQWFYVVLLLDSANVRDLINRTDMISRVLRANSNVAAELSATKATLERQKSELAHSLDSINAKRAEAVAVENGLLKLQGERQGKANEQKSVLNQKSELLAETKKNASHLLAIANAEEAESNRIESELAAHRGSGRYSGSMAWPVPGFYNVTSSFGMRMHPVLHVKRMHTGIDIGKNGKQAIAGAAIVAVGKGKVIYAGYRNGYGNTVMIDHGNGVVTLYAHQPSGGIRVSNGQSVKKGQRIGTVGMTGYATGPHLHFEVRINGNPVNPLNYL